MQLERDQINELWHVVHIAVELATRLAAKNDGIAVRVDVLDRFVLVWNSGIACKRVNMISQEINDMYWY